MLLNRSRGRVGAPFAGVVLALVLGATTAGADVTVERTTKSGGFGGFGAGETTSVEKISGLRKRSVSSMKMTGMLGRMAGDLGSDEITDIPKDTVSRIDHKKKTYTESRITPPNESGEGPGGMAGPGGMKGRDDGAEKQDVRIVRNEVTVRETGEKKAIGGYPCAHYVITWVVETEDLETKERGESTMTSDLWTTPETSEIRAAMKEEREFSQAWLKKLGWDMSDQDARKLGMGMIGAMLGGDEESFKKGAKEVAAKMEKIKGYPIATGIRWQVKSSGGEGDGDDDGGGREGMPDIAKGLGGLMAAMGRKGGKSGAAAGDSNAAGGANTVFDTYSEIRKISTASLPDSEFAPPAGYKKVAP